MDVLNEYEKIQKRRLSKAKKMARFYERRGITPPNGITKVETPLCQEESRLVFDMWPKIMQNIFVISIRPARLKKCLKRLGILASLVTIIPACDGKYIDRYKWTAEGTLSPKCNLTSGMLGCFESHCRIWRYVIENNIDYALILEDDACLLPTSTILYRILRCLDDIKAMNLQWDMLFLGRSFKKHQNFKRLTPNVTVPGEFWGMFAYSIKNQCARYLIRQKEITTYKLPVDVVISRLGRRRRLRLLAIDPPACIQVRAWSDTNNIK